MLEPVAVARCSGCAPLMQALYGNRGGLVVVAIGLLPGAVPLGRARAVEAKLGVPSRNLRLYPEQSFRPRTASPDPRGANAYSAIPDSWPRQTRFRPLST